MKKSLSIPFGICIITGLFLLYVVDRILTSFLFWIEIQPFSIWFPKATKHEVVKMEFPTLSSEAILSIIETRKKSWEYIKNSAWRMAIYAGLFVIYLLICLLS